VGGGFGVGAWAGAVGAATANAVGGYLRLLNQVSGDCGCNK
jgi:hypothetical protein